MSQGGGSASTTKLTSAILYIGFSGYLVAPPWLFSGSLVVWGKWLSGGRHDGVWLFAGYFMATRTTDRLS
jgi:hypothetical protein